MNRLVSTVLVLLVPLQGSTGSAAIEGTIDDAVSAALKERGIACAPPCSDAVFIRRVSCDLTGTLPTPSEVKAFLADPDPNRRAALIDSLMDRPEFADYWAMKWCDALRVKSEFPINLWPNAVQAYHRWIRDAIRENRPYDQMARELLTSSGSSLRAPQVNFYRAVQRGGAADIAGAVALTFMGTRLDGMPKDRANGLSAFFSRVSYKATSEWKEEIVLLNPAPVPATTAILPDGTTVALPPEKDPRQVFADWLITPDNPWFARAIANRVWAWVFGRGIVHEPDDLRPDNPPSIPALLAVLEREIVVARFDLRHLYRLILNSRTYQQSCVPAGNGPGVPGLFASYPVRRLDAEVLLDALGVITGSREEYSSQIPEPYTFIPEKHRTIELPDGSITSPFLETFGRPSRDTGLFSERNNECTDAQRLYLLNSSAIQRKLESSPALRAIAQSGRGNPGRVIEEVYLLILSRYPEKEEVEAARRHLKTKGISPKQALDDLAWALINTKEFLFRH